MSFEAALEELKKLEARAAAPEDPRPEWLKAASDPAGLYYRFLYELSKPEGEGHPRFAVEIGTYTGGSAAHMAALGCRVLTIDSNPNAARLAARFGMPNLEAVTSDSMAFIGDLASYPPIDILFIDGNHTFNQAYGEYEGYRRRVRDGGVILFDDLALPMATREMEVLWEFIPDPKVRLDSLHSTGFGAAVKDPSVRVPPWEEIITRATERFGK